jgi:hypothetical protein
VQHCKRCDRDLPLDAFHPGKQGQAGTYCRACSAEYQRQRRDARRGLPQHTVLIKIPKVPKARRELSTTYRALHARLSVKRGKAQEHQCQHCGDQAMDWSYDHSDPNELTQEWYGKTVAYSCDLDRYLPLCRPCHTKLDNPYDGSSLQRLNKSRQHQHQGQGVDPEPRPMTDWNAA